MKKTLLFTSQEQREINQLMDDIYNDAVDLLDMSWSDLAKRAGLSYSTVYRLGERITLNPQIKTVLRLAGAVGRKVTLERRIPVRRRKYREVGMSAVI